MNWFFHRSNPRFGQVCLWAILLCATVLSCYFLAQATQGRAGERQWPVTVFSFLSDRILFWRPAQWGFAALFAVNGLLWVLRRGVPYTGWLTAIGFTGTIALYVENHVDLTHTSHVTCMFLWLYAMWYDVEGDAVRRTTTEGAFWDAPLYPQWTFTLGLFYLGLFYGMSGWMKFFTSGPGWANGVSMQLWAEMWGDRSSPLTWLILQHRWASQAMQALTLAAECAAPLAIVSRRARVVLGLLLISFHIGAISVFRWGFHANAVLIGLHFFPVREWLESRSSVKQAEQGP